MAATNASFNKPLENSVKDFRLKSLKKPFIGEILSIEGVKLCPLKTKPLTINLKNIATVAEAGADTFVAGSAIFNEENYSKIIKQMRSSLEAL